MELRPYEEGQRQPMNQTIHTAFRIIIALWAALIGPSIAWSQQPAYQAGFVQWQAGENGFQSWERQGVRVTSSGMLRMDLPASVTQQDPYSAGGFYGGNYYSGGSFQVGEAVSPMTAAANPSVGATTRAAMTMSGKKVRGIQL